MARMVERVREHEFPKNVVLADLQIPAALSSTTIPARREFEQSQKDNHFCLSTLHAAFISGRRLVC